MCAASNTPSKQAGCTCGLNVTPAEPPIEETEKVEEALPAPVEAPVPVEPPVPVEAPAAPSSLRQSATRRKKCHGENEPCRCKAKSGSKDLPAPLAKLFRHIDTNKAKYIEVLREAVAIPSVSSCPSKRPDTVRVMEWAADRLRGCGVEVARRDLGMQTLDDGSEIPLPPVVLGTLGRDPGKKTVLVYGHLDVVPAEPADGWESDPFVLEERDGKLLGRGATDDKGPVVGWLNLLSAYKETGLEIPVNLRVIFEGMEEAGSVGLHDLLRDEKDKFLSDTEFICISDNYWLGTEKPCLTYGTRGICYFCVEIQCANKDLHSGMIGGSVYEAMSDLIYMLGTLVDKEGNILITDIQKNVDPIEDGEVGLYTEINFDVNDYRTNIGATKLCHDEDKVQLLMHRWRLPSLSIHGIEGAYSAPGARTIVPSKVIGKFSIRLVPHQTAEEVTAAVTDYLEGKWQERGSCNKFRVYVDYSGEPWTTDPNQPNYMAARRAIQHVYRVEPDMTREGGSIHIAVAMQEVTDKSVLLLPMGAGDDGAHLPNEKIDVRNFIEGTKVWGAYLYEISQL